MADGRQLENILEVTKQFQGMVTKEARIVMKDSASGHRVTVKIEPPKSGLLRFIKKSFTKGNKPTANEPEPMAQPPPVPSRFRQANTELYESDYQCLEYEYYEEAHRAPRAIPGPFSGNVGENLSADDDGYIEVPSEVHGSDEEPYEEFNPSNGIYHPLPVPETDRPGQSTTVWFTDGYENADADTEGDITDDRERSSYSPLQSPGAHDSDWQQREQSFGDDLEAVYNNLRLGYENIKEKKARDCLSKKHEMACLPVNAGRQCAPETPDYWIS